MSEEWREMTLGEVTLINPEQTPKWSADRAIRYVDIASVSEVRGIDLNRVQTIPFGEAPGRARRLIRAQDTLVSTVRPNLRAFAMVPPSLDGEVASTGFAVLRPQGRWVDPGFVWAVVRSAAFVEDMVSKCTGSNYPAIRAEDVASFRLWVPPLSVQRRIVDVVGAVDAHIAKLSEEASALWRMYGDALGHSLAGDLVQLGDLMKLDLDVRRVRDSDEFRILGVLNRGGGLIDKGVVRGSDTGYASLNRISAGQLVMRKLTAWEGPISVVPDEFDGYYASAEFPSFSIDETRLLPEFMGHVCRAPALWQQMKERVTGTVQRRKRLKPEQLLEVAMRVPALAEQRAFAGALTSLQRAAQHLEKEAGALAVLRRQVLESLLSREVEVPESYDVLLGAGVA